MSALSDALNEANVERWSTRDIARRGGDRVSHTQVAKYLKPDHPRPGEEVLSVFAEAFKIPITELRRLADLPAGDLDTWDPPAEANRLDRRQRRLVDELIRMLAETKGGDGDVGRDAAPTKGPGSGPGSLTYIGDHAAARDAGKPPRSQRQPPAPDVDDDLPADDPDDFTPR